MSLSRCPHCKARVRSNHLKIHILKECRVNRQIKKREFNVRITQTLDYRLDCLKQFPNEPVPENLKDIPDNSFNELIARLEHKYALIKNSLENKKEKLNARLEEIDRMQKLQAENELKEKERRDKEELDRLEQLKREQDTHQAYTEKRNEQEKVFEKSRPTPVTRFDDPDELKRDIEEMQGILSPKEPTIEELREMAKAKKVKGYHNMKPETLKEKLGIK